MLGLIYRPKAVSLDLTEHAITAHVVITVTRSFG